MKKIQANKGGKVFIGTKTGSVQFYFDDSDNLKKFVVVLIDEGISFRCNHDQLTVEVYGEKV